MSKSKPTPGFSPIRIHTAGIDIGSSSHFVAVSPDDVPDDGDSVREFPCFTEDLERLATWLHACGVEEVAMESTGVYWIPVYELLEARGFTVLLINARHIKNVSGRKSDVLDCQWILQLLRCGLLSGAFRPEAEICALRSITRQRENLLQDQARHIQRMQKALIQMNLSLTQVISDIVGESGQRILRAIVAGERDGWVLAKLCSKRIKASHADIAKALQGSWQPAHLFVLKLSLAAYDAHTPLLTQCDQEIERLIRALERHPEPKTPITHRGRAKNAPKFDVHTRLYQMCGVDLTQINGIDATTALKIISEVGTDFSKFPSAKHFASWLGLCPGTKISGGRVLSAKTKRTENRAAQALKQAVVSLRSSQSAIGAYYRRLCFRLDKAKAITAAAHKLARIIYTLMTKGSAFVEQGQAYYEERYQHRLLNSLKKRAEALGCTLVPNNIPSTA